MRGSGIVGVLTSKDCTKCGQHLPVEAFGIVKAFRGRKERYQSWCKVCSQAQHSVWVSMNREKMRAHSKRDYRKHKEARRASRRAWSKANLGRNVAKNLRLKYGISTEEWEQLYREQNGLCAICGGVPGGSAKKLHVDHDHATGRVRGLLCHACNIAIGLMRDDSERLRKATEYVERHRSAGSPAEVCKP